MDKEEKKLLWRCLGMILWLLKELVLASAIGENKKDRIVKDKLNPLIRSVTERVNQG